MNEPNSVKAIIRSTEGSIGRRDFHRGTIMLVFFSIIAALLFWGIDYLGKAMEWKTVVVAPFFGALLFVVLASLTYFWFALFLKRMRDMKQPVFGVYGWLFALLAFLVFKLIAYEDANFQLFEPGSFLAFASQIGTLFGFLAAILFFILLGVCAFGPDGDAGQGSCDLNSPSQQK